MPHQCTNCSRVFDDGSKEMLGGCPDCGGNTFQFRPEGSDFDVDTDDKTAGGTGTPDSPPSGRSPGQTGQSTVAKTVGRTAATVRDLVGSSDESNPRIGAEVPRSVDGDPATNATEDTAQASARSDVVMPDELPVDVGSGDGHEFRPARTENTTSPGTDRSDPQVSKRPDGTSEPSTETESDSGTADERPESGQSGRSEREQTERPVDRRSTAEATTAETDRPDLEALRAELNDQFESIKVLNPGQYELNLMELYDREAYIIALQEDGKYSIQMPEAVNE